MSTAAPRTGSSRLDPVAGRIAAGVDRGTESEFWAGGKVLALGLGIVAVILVGMAIESRILTTGGVFVALAAAVAVPQLGLIILAAIGPLKPPAVIQAPGFEVALVGAALLGSVYRLPVDRRRITVSGPLLALAGFVGFAFVSQLPSFLSGYGSPRAHDIGFLFYQLATGLGAIVVAGFVLRDRPPYPVFVALLTSALLAAVLAIATADGRGGPLGNLVAQADAGSRASGPFGNPNSFGQCMAYGSLLAIAWASVTRRSPTRWALLGTAGVLLYALVASLSRGAFAALLAGLVAFAFNRSRATGIVALIAALGLVGIGYPLFLQLRLSIDAGGFTSSALAGLNSSDAGRLDAVLAGPALFARSPVFGIGFGQYKYMTGLVSDYGAGLVAHNWYGTVLAELGIVGVVLWAALLVSVARWLRRRPAVPRAVGGPMFVAALVGCMFLEPPTAFQTSVIPAMVLTAALVADWSTGRAETVGATPRTSQRPAIVPGSRRAAQRGD